nr:MAG: hypothetical protein E4H34_06465 [Hyphomicrobiales bacterium]
MTAALLARKGEAAPSAVAGHIGPKGIEPAVRETLLRSAPQVTDAKQLKRNASPSRPLNRAAPGLVAGTKRRVVLTLTNEEFERIGIAAVKKNITRQQLARDALFTYLTAIAPNYESCPCLTGNDPCDCE